MADLKTKLGRLGGFARGLGQPPGSTSTSVGVSGVGFEGVSPTVNLEWSSEGVGEAPMFPASGWSNAMPRGEALRRRLANMRTFRKPQVQRAGLQPLPGSEIVTAWGAMHVIQARDPAHTFHGDIALNACLQSTAEHLALLSLDPTLRRIDVSRLLFFDTETTGLMGGSGTVPFLIGMGWFENDHWHLEQLLLRQPGDEEPILRRVAERLHQASALVTYNGKTFDWPLLKARFVLSHLSSPPELPHLDLLHGARRLLHRRQQGLRLVHVEKHLLNFHREGDIEGAAIPSTYFSYLRGAHPGVLTPIITHNAYDVRALAAMLGGLLRHLDGPQAVKHSADRLAVAELNWRAGAYEQALAFAKAATTQSSAAVTYACEAHLLVARLQQRQKNWQAAALALHAALQAPDADPLRCASAHLALAKLYEHRLRDMSRALQHAAHTATVEGQAAHARRLARLRQRC